MRLFDDDWGEGSQEPDDTQIKTTILYYSEEELKEFKKLSKKAIEIHFKEQRFDKGNYSDLILFLLKKYTNEEA